MTPGAPAPAPVAVDMPDDPSASPPLAELCVRLVAGRMFARVDRAQLLDALRWALTAVDRRSPVPALQRTVVLDGDRRPSEVQVSGFDYERLAEHEVAAPGSAGACLVDGYLLQQMLRALPKQITRLRLAADGQVLTITGTAGPDLPMPGAIAQVTLRLPLADRADEYPTPKVDPHLDMLWLTQQELTGLAPVVACASTDPAAFPVLTGVQIHGKSDSPAGLTPSRTVVRFEAVDRYRCARVSLTRERTSWRGGSVLFPAWVLRDAIAAARRQTAPVALMLPRSNRPGDDGHPADSASLSVGVDLGIRRVYTRPVMGSPPPLDALIPTAPADACITVNPAEFAPALRLAAAALGPEAPIASATIETLAERDLEVRTGIRPDQAFPLPRARTLVPAGNTSQISEVTLRVSYLLDALAAAGKAEYVTLDQAEPHKPVRILTPSRPDLVQMVMPVRLAGS